LTSEFLAGSVAPARDVLGVPGTNAGYNTVLGFLRKQREREGERAFTLVALLKCYELPIDAEVLAWAYSVQRSMAETWLFAAEKAGFIQPETHALTEKGERAMERCDEIAARHRSVVEQLPADSPIGRALAKEQQTGIPAFIEPPLKLDVFARMRNNGDM
jgi:hypothetical protein